MCAWKADDGRGAEFARSFAAEEQRKRPPGPTRPGACTLYMHNNVVLFDV